jgi:hypothetical protein
MRLAKAVLDRWQPPARLLRLFWRLVLAGFAAFVLDLALPEAVPEFWRGFAAGLAVAFLVASVVVASYGMLRRA